MLAVGLVGDLFPPPGYSLVAAWAKLSALAAVAVDVKIGCWTTWVAWRLGLVVLIFALGRKVLCFAGHGGSDDFAVRCCLAVFQGVQVALRMRHCARLGLRSEVPSRCSRRGRPSGWACLLLACPCVCGWESPFRCGVPCGLRTKARLVSCPLWARGSLSARKAYLH